MSSTTNTSSPPIVSAAIVNVPTSPSRPTGAHPAAELFPLMNGTDFGMLVEDIEAHGLLEPILVCQGLVLDGRNRLRACELAGVEPRFVEWDGVGSPLAVVLSRNLHRRHLDESQRSIIAARAKGMFEDEAAERERAHQFGQTAAKTPQNTATANLQLPGRTANAQAAELLNVSERSVASASRVLERGDEHVIAAVESGNIAVSDARAIADRPKHEQRQALDIVRQGRVRTLRQAAEQEFGEQPPRAVASPQPEPAFSRKRLRTEGKRFTRDLEKLLHRLDAITAACGGPNDYTRHIQECLTTVLRALHGCMNQLLGA